MIFSYKKIFIIMKKWVMFTLHTEYLSINIRAEYSVFNSMNNLSIILNQAVKLYRVKSVKELINIWIKISVKQISEKLKDLFKQELDTYIFDTNLYTLLCLY